MNNKKPTFTHAVFWSFAEQFLRLFLRLIVSAVLARLILPADFGMLAMASVFIGFLSIFKNMGLSAAVIYDQNIRKKDIDNIFWFMVLMSFAISVIIFFIAYPVSAFYHNPQFIPIVRVLALLFFISSLAIIPDTLIKKKLDFKAFFLRNISNIVISGAIAIYLAYKGWGIWALIAQQYITQIYHIIVSFKMVDWCPSFYFKPKELKPYFHYGLPLMGLSIVNYFSRNTDTLIVGKFLGPKITGYYNKAYGLMNLPVNNISSSVSRVLFPSLSALQDNKEMIWKKYLKLMGVTAYITFPLMAIMYLLAHEIILGLYGPQWENSVPLFKAFCVLGAIQTLAYTGTIFQSIGKTKVIFILNIFLKLFIVFGIIAGYFINGLMGVIWGLTVTNLLGLIINKFYLAKTFRHPFREIPKVLFHPFWMTISFVGVSIIFIRNFAINKWIVVFGLGFPVYLLLSYWFKPAGYLFIKEKVSSIIRHKVK